MEGMEEMISPIRISTISAAPPIHPENAPARIPSIPLISVLDMPTSRLIPAPYHTRAKRSRPNRSVPNQWVREKA